MTSAIAATNGAADHATDESIDQLYAWFPPQVPAPAVAPLPEAPASCNVYVQISGRKVQVTLRDSDEQRMLERLQILLQRFPDSNVESRPPQPPAQHANTGEGWCSTHGVQMTLNTKEGRSWWSHRTAEGQWCKGK
jgi:hypothetical protein